MKKTNIVQRVQAIKERMTDVKDRVIQYLETIRETQDAHLKSLSEKIDKRADDVTGQLSDLSKTVSSQADKRTRDTNSQLSDLSKSVSALVDKQTEETKTQLQQVGEGLYRAVDETTDRLDQQFSVLSHLLASHHAAMMTLLGAGGDEEKYKILPPHRIEFDLLPLLPQRPVVTVLDVGAMPMGMRAESYSPLQGAGICRLIGIEPDEESFQKLKQLYPRDTFLQKWVGTGDRQMIHWTGDRKNASLYEPDKRIASCFEHLAETMLLEHKEDVNTVRLDDLSELHDVDLIMNDAQGAELDILKGAQKSLDSAVVVECEVEFVQLYKDQPLFADVDTFLRSKGYQFHKFTHQTGRLRHDYPPELVLQTRSTQVLWANAVYVRSMFELEKIPKLKLLKLAVIMHMVYKSYDLALAALNVYDRSFNTRVGPAYKKALTRAVLSR
ncbi:MAG TPA: FkbM family methyltransferase [Planktothrix sp.]|jgi:FkbM family methyltransferase